MSDYLTVIPEIKALVSQAYQISKSLDVYNWEIEEWVLIQLIRVNNPKLSVLGIGASRICVAHVEFPDVVFKYQYDFEYGNDNFNELDRYEQIPAEFKKYFAEPFYMTNDETILVMERAYGQTAFDHCDYNSNLRNVIQDLVYEFNCNQNAFSLSDIHGYNVIVTRDGDLKIVDYAGA